jgi:hypothetical protein
LLRHSTALPSEPRLVKCEDDLAGFAAFHGLDGGFEFGEGHLVGDDGGDVEALFVEEPDHLVPSFPEAAADDAVDREAFENSFVDVDGLAILGIEAEEGDASAGVAVVDGEFEGGGVPGHFEDGVESVGGVFGEEGGDVIGEGVEDEIGPGIDAELGAVGRNLGGEDIFCTETFADGDSKQADGAESGDKNGFPFDGAIHDGVDGIAEGIEHARYVFGDAGRDEAGVHRGDNGVGGESAVYIHSEELSGAVNVSESVEVVGRSGIDDVRFRGDKITGFSVGDVRGDFENGAAEFVSNNAGGFDPVAGPVVPVVDVKIGAAEGCAFDSDFDGAGLEGRFGDFNDFESGCGLRLCNRFHGSKFTSRQSLTMG